MARKTWKYKNKRLPVKTSNYTSTYDKTREEKLKELARKTGQVNKRLRAIKREFGSLGWAGETIKDKTEYYLVNTWRNYEKRIGIRFNKNTITDEQIDATLAYMNNFLKSKSATVRGVKRIMTKQQESLKQTLSTDDKELTIEESKSLYKLFDDKDYNYITKFIPESDLFVLLQDAKENKDTEEQYFKRVENYITIGEDDDLREALLNLYNRWVL